MAREQHILKFADVTHKPAEPVPISYAQVRFVLQHLADTGHHIVPKSWQTEDYALTVDAAEALFSLTGG